MPVDRRTFVAGSAALGAVALTGCATAGTDAGVLVGPEIDAVFNQPYVDVDEWRDQPERHRYVHGGFRGTEARFLILFPPQERYQGRFIQHNTAIPASELLAGNIWNDTFSSFCFASGGACVVTNQNAGLPDPTFASYRVAAAAARYTRVLAQQMYGAHRTYGYAFGGSGGGYRTLSCAEHTDVWDGVVPYIHGNMQAWPNCYAGRARGQRALKHNMAQIADAMEPGGGDIYASLNAEERGILSEVTKLGFPPRTWVFHETMGIGPLQLIFPNIQRLDPTYFEEFWTTPGYLGHDSPQSFNGVRVQHRARVTRVIMSNDAGAAGLTAPARTGRRPNPADPDEAWRVFQIDNGGPVPVALELGSRIPAGAWLDMANINVATGARAGSSVVFGGVAGERNTIAKFQFAATGGPPREITDAIRAGDEVVIDNSNALAYETYYRHLVLSPDYYTGNQFRGPDGRPLYPQRPVDISLELMRGSTPTIPTGQFHGKMIIVQNMLDWDAQPWYADWYRTKVREHLGARFSDNYRLNYIDHATHGSIPDPTRTVVFSGVLQQALRDVAAWAERGVAPPQESNYRVVDGQVVLPATASERRGVQPVVTLLANGRERAEVRAGQAVTFSAVAETPPGAGAIVSAEWDFSATQAVVAGDANRFPIREQFAPAARVTLTQTHTFTQPGTYYPALRVHSQRDGDATTPYARIANLGRVRVVVT